MRTANIERKTNETQVSLSLSLDGTGKHDINTGCGFLDHMLQLFASHSYYDLVIKASGDTEVDYHHTVEDVGICLGQAFISALGNKKGLVRYGSILLPMDEALIAVALDLSGRAYLNCEVSFPDDYKVGDFDTELVEEFLTSFVRESKITLHIIKKCGKNVHHIIEGMFKGLARALAMATKIDKEHMDILPSSKGSL